MTVTKYDCVIVSADGVATPVLPAEDAGAASTLDAGNGDTQGVKSNAGFARNTVSRRPKWRAARRRALVRPAMPAFQYECFPTPLAVSS